MAGQNVTTSDGRMSAGTQKTSFEWGKDFQGETEVPEGERLRGHAENKLRVGLNMGGHNVSVFRGENEAPGGERPACTVCAGTRKKNLEWASAWVARM